MKVELRPPEAPVGIFAVAHDVDAVVAVQLPPSVQNSNGNVLPPLLVREFEVINTDPDLLKTKNTRRSLGRLARTLFEPHPLSDPEAQYQHEIWDPSSYPPGLQRLRQGVGQVALSDGTIQEFDSFRELLVVPAFAWRRLRADPSRGFATREDFVQYLTITGQTESQAKRVATNLWNALARDDEAWFDTDGRLDLDRIDEELYEKRFPKRIAGKNYLPQFLMQPK